MKKLAIVVAAIAIIGTPALAADLPVKAPPPAPLPTWTGFYAGIQLGYGWSDHEAVSYSPNDPVAAEFLSGSIVCSIWFCPSTLGQPVVAPSVRQSGAVGGLEFGYNWQAASSWLVGFEADFSASGLRGSATNVSLAGIPVFGGVPSPILQNTTAEQRGDWYGTVRGRLGWLATPSLLLFGTGGFAYGRVVDSANYGWSNPPGIGVAVSENDVAGVSFACSSMPGFLGFPRCYSGSSGGIRTGWTAGGGLEWLFSQHWTAKIEYQFVDLGTQTVPITNVNVVPGFTPSSFNAVFHDHFNVVRVGLNYKFDWGAPLVANY